LAPENEKDPGGYPGLLSSDRRLPAPSKLSVEQFTRAEDGLQADRDLLRLLLVVS